MKLEKDVLPKYYRLEQILRKHITTGKLANDRPMPNERELCELHGVSRTTVRNALAALEADGLIYREQGRGTFVKYNPDKWCFELRGSVEDLFNLGTNIFLALTERKTIEPEEWLVNDLKLPEKQPVLYYEGIRKLYDDIDVFFQAYLSEDIGNLVRIEDVKGSLFIQTVEEKTGESVKSAVQITSAVTAEAWLAEKINCSIGDPILLQKRIYYSKRNRVLQVSLNHFPGLVYQSVAQLTRD